MNWISLTDHAKNQPLEPLLEKEVQVRAYEIYEQRGKGHGFALQDWLNAEAEVLARFPQTDVDPARGLSVPHARFFKANLVKPCTISGPWDVTIVGL
jgi:hypothetical protein